MPCILRTAHTASYYRATPTQSPRLVRRDRGDGGGVSTVLIILLVVGGVLGAALFYFCMRRWAIRSHKKANQKARRHMKAPTKGRRFYGPGISHPVGQASFADDDVELGHRSRGHRSNRAGRQVPSTANGLEQEHPSASCSHRLHNPELPRVPPPAYCSHSSKADTAPVGPPPGLGRRGDDGRMHRAQSIDDYMNAEREDDRSISRSQSHRSRGTRSTRSNRPS